MIQKIDEYVNALLKSNVSADDIEKTKSVINATKEVCEILDSPSVPMSEKINAIGELFPNSIKEVMAKIAEDNSTKDFDKIAKEYRIALDKKNNIATATVTYVTEPNDEQLEGLKAFVCKETGAATANIELVKDASIIGGFIIQVGNKQYDRSLKSKLENKRNCNPKC
jgi:ATP synthase F1 delta subunit